ECESIKRLNDVKASERGKRMKSRYKSLVALMVWGALFLIATSPINPVLNTSAQGDDCLDRARCGEVSPLIPMQSTEAVHMGLVWKRNSSTPKILFHARFPEYTPNDMADPALVDWPSCAEPLPRPDLSSTHR